MTGTMAGCAHLICYKNEWKCNVIHVLKINLAHICLKHSLILKRPSGWHWPVVGRPRSDSSARGWESPKHLKHRIPKSCRWTFRPSKLPIRLPQPWGFSIWGKETSTASPSLVGAWRPSPPLPSAVARPTSHHPCWSCPSGRSTAAPSRWYEAALVSPW